MVCCSLTSLSRCSGSSYEGNCGPTPPPKLRLVPPPRLLSTPREYGLSANLDLPGVLISTIFCELAGALPRIADRGAARLRGVRPPMVNRRTALFGVAANSVCWCAYRDGVVVGAYLDGVANAAPSLAALTFFFPLFATRIGPW